MVHSEKINHLKRKSKEDDNGKNNSRFFLTCVCVLNAANVTSKNVFIVFLIFAISKSRAFRPYLLFKSLLVYYQLISFTLDV